MQNLFDVDTPQPLIILRGEYGIISGDNAIIASPNAKSGVVFILSDVSNKITAMAHLDEEQNPEENIEKILSEMAKLGANLSNLTCNIVENDKSSH
jgi:chemotaxis receptor (MCP) glutamine deamidase CheD